MLPTILITALLLTTPDALDAWNQPGDPWIQINLWDSHPIQPIHTKVKTEPEPKLRPAAVPRPNPPAAPPSSPPGVEQWRELVTTHFPPDQVDTALAVMACESGGDPNAKNPNSSARGLMQILASLWAPEFGLSYDDLYNPETNLWVARQIFDQAGWNAWSAYKKGCR